MRDDWLGAAQETPVDSCVSGRLGVAMAGAIESTMIANTTIRAARARGLHWSRQRAEPTVASAFQCPPTTIGT